MINCFWFIAGAALGILNILAQWWTVCQVQPQNPRRAVSLVVGGAIVRLILVASLLCAAVQHGVFAGVLAFAGLWGARWLVLSRIDARWMLPARFC